MFVLIGGKANKEILTNNIEKEIIKLSKKEKPTILYCGFAAKTIEKSNNKFLKLVENLNCEIIFMDYNNITTFENLLIKSDILYIGGGVSDDLVDIFKNNKLDIILKNHINDDKIFAGSSAGAMLYTKASMGDKYMFLDNFHNYNYKMVNCLNILNITICPHYQNEDLIIYNDELKKYDCDAFGIEEDSALVIDGNKFYCLKEENKVSVYYFKKDEDYKMISLKKGEIYEKDSGFRS